MHMCASLALGYKYFQLECRYELILEQHRGLQQHLSMTDVRPLFAALALKQIAGALVCSLI